MPETSDGVHCVTNTTAPKLSSYTVKSDSDWIKNQ